MTGPETLTIVNRSVPSGPHGSARGTGV